MMMTMMMMMMMMMMMTTKFHQSPHLCGVLHMNYVCTHPHTRIARWLLHCFRAGRRSIAAQRSRSPAESVRRLTASKAAFRDTLPGSTPPFPPLPLPRYPAPSLRNRGGAGDGGAAAARQGGRAGAAERGGVRRDRGGGGGGRRGGGLDDLQAGTSPPPPPFPPTQLLPFLHSSTPLSSRPSVRPSFLPFLPPSIRSCRPPSFPPSLAGSLPLSLLSISLYPVPPPPPPPPSERREGGGRTCERQTE